MKPNPVVVFLVSVAASAVVVVGGLGLAFLVATNPPADLTLTALIGVGVVLLCRAPASSSKDTSS